MSDWELLGILLFGLPNSNIGGLSLSILVFVSSALLGLSIGLLYALVGVTGKALGRTLFVAFALIRGIPPILLVFGSAHLLPGSIMSSAILALALYSACHIGEVFRGYLNVYPTAQTRVAKVLHIPIHYDWLMIRIPWLLGKSFEAIKTHWISLLKDTGALIVVGVAELTTVTKLIVSSSYSTSEWLKILSISASLYLIATLTLIFCLRYWRMIWPCSRSHQNRHEFPLARSTAS